MTLLLSSAGGKFFELPPRLTFWRCQVTVFVKNKNKGVIE